MLELLNTILGLFPELEVIFSPSLGATYKKDFYCFMIIPGKWNPYYISYLKAKIPELYLKTAQFWQQCSAVSFYSFLSDHFFKNTVLE
jgi:hypothetical protein